ncbi:N-acetylglucosamine-6-sulfatase-like [Phlebotomus argentipes]|uniref:N-acetylglucosamine-6-sulfatase-like n=1 Tax=Phlebotomus argentipes TaxID=94469 RepID=UPI002892A44D|nr:N-acetylglucosamine-6-sulfatase-like [Phlebotomus argentipes]
MEKVNLMQICVLFWVFGTLVSCAKLPNVVLIVTDDQDVVLNGMMPMKSVQECLAKEGATFINAFTSSPICCPSRASILTGRYAHNHATINNSMSGGCYGRFWRDVMEKNTLPMKLQAGGYETFFAGKYLNDYKTTEVPLGWNHWHGLHGNSVYYNYTLTENGKAVRYEAEYLTDILAQRSAEFLQQYDQSKPFFLMVAPPAPHAPATAAQRHENQFPEIRAKRTPNFNEPSGSLDKHWLLTMQPSRLPDEVLPELDEITRKRWKSLLAVDELVERIYKILKEGELLDQTFIVFTSDNGYHVGQFAQAYDKRQAYETDIRVPLVVRGPGIAAKTVVQQPVLLLDLMPTMLEWAQIPLPANLDGRSFRRDFMANEEQQSFSRQFLVEYWGEADAKSHSPSCKRRDSALLYGCTEDAACHCQDSKNNTYACVRRLDSAKDFLYCEFRDSQHFAEAYDLLSDPYQMHNLAFEMLPSERAIYSLVLKNLTTCIGPTCRAYHSR